MRLVTVGDEGRRVAQWIVRMPMEKIRLPRWSDDEAWRTKGQSCMVEEDLPLVGLRQGAVGG